MVPLSLIAGALVAVVLVKLLLHFVCLYHVHRRARWEQHYALGGSVRLCADCADTRRRNNPDADIRRIA